LYQGRVFKGLIYLVCIHAAFFTGMCLGEGMTVHHKVPPNAQGWRKISLSYAAQVGSGIWALPALVQARRVDAKENRSVFSLTDSLTAPFKGAIESSGPGSEGLDGPLVGTIALHPAEDPAGRDVEGTFTGTLKGKPITLNLANGFEMDKPIGASPGRALKIRVQRQAEDHPNLDLVLHGTIPRPLRDWYEVPPETVALQEITGRLGKYFELALVFTWIAGLLNILAIWDCVKGPSLGFGDEKPVAAQAESTERMPTATKPPEPAIPVATVPTPAAGSPTVPRK
jgi:hypothetical protein